MVLPKSAALARARLIDTESAIPPCQSNVSRQTGELTDECKRCYSPLGSTGKPRGCQLSNRYFIQVSDWYRGAGRRRGAAAGGEINLTPLPMFHMNALGCGAVGMMCVAAALSCRSTVSTRTAGGRAWPTAAQPSSHCLGVILAILLQLPVSEAERRHSVRLRLRAGRRCAPSRDLRGALSHPRSWTPGR